jgi:hypothetical protein
MNLDYRKNIDNTKNVYNINKCTKLLNKIDNLEKIGEGKEGIIYYVTSPQCGSVVMKINKEEKNQTHENEKKFISLIQKIILDDICPNFIYTYIVNNKYILMEYADGDLSKLYKDEDIFFNKIIIKNIIFQILMGILVMQKILFMVHNDLYIKNIFYKKISKSNIKYFEYNINGEKFYLENIGFLIIIADFGNSQSLLIPESDNRYTYSKIKNMIKNNYDLVLLNKILFSYEYKKIIKYIFSLKTDIYTIINNNYLHYKNIDISKLSENQIKKFYINYKSN